jgi:hypothetical protein
MFTSLHQRKANAEAEISRPRSPESVL